MLNYHNYRTDLDRVFFGPDRGHSYGESRPQTDEGQSTPFSHELILGVTSGLLRKLRHECDKSTSGLAQDVGMKEPAISRIENENQLPSLEVLAKLSTGLELSFPNLLRRLADEFERIQSER